MITKEAKQGGGEEISNNRVVGDCSEMKRFQGEEEAAIMLHQKEETRTMERGETNANTHVTGLSASLTELSLYRPT